jgi:hypothetical protein
VKHRLLLVGFILAAWPNVAEAASPVLRVAPLRYDAHLELGHVKEGTIDTSNPTGSTVHVYLEVQGFRQVAGDQHGALEYYDDPRLSAAIKPLNPDFDLGPREAVRTRFTIDPNVLGSGGAYAVIFARTATPGGTGVSTSARVGTLLILDVGTGGTRSGRLSQLDVPWLILGHHELEAAYRYGNTGAGDRALAFTPRLEAGLGTMHKQIDGPFVFPGRERAGSVRFDLGNRLGVYRVTLRDQTGGAAPVTRWVVMATGWWPWALLVLLALGLAGGWWRVRRSKKR